MDGHAGRLEKKTRRRIQSLFATLRHNVKGQDWVGYLEFGHPCCVRNNEVKYNEVQNTTKFNSYVIAVVLIKQHVSAYCEAIIRFTMLATGHY